MRHPVWYALAVAVVAPVVAACGSTTTGGTTASSVATSTSTTCSVTTGQSRPSSSVCANSGAGGTAVPSPSSSSFTLDGTYRGKSLAGHVNVHQVECTPITTGTSSGVQVTWDGTLNLTAGGSESASGDFSVPQFGSFVFPNNDPKTPTMSLVIANDQSGRYGLSGGSFGTGSGTLQASLHSGSVDAIYQMGGNGSETAHLQGSWSC